MRSVKYNRRFLDVLNVSSGLEATMCPEEEGGEKKIVKSLSRQGVLTLRLVCPVLRDTTTLLGINDASALGVATINSPTVCFCLVPLSLRRRDQVSNQIGEFERRTRSPEVAQWSCALGRKRTRSWKVFALDRERSLSTDDENAIEAYRKVVSRM